ncbi:MAG: hypothetical protein RLY31_1010 [Bacteroidota bacterium]|jgi:hypothetical protein
MKKAVWLTFGFLLFLLGFTGLVLSLVGIKLALLVWMDVLGAWVSFLAKALMIILGIIIVYLTTTDWRSEA